MAGSFVADRDSALSEVAGRQHRIVSSRRLRSLGFSDGAVRRRVAKGLLQRLYTGVYLVGPGEPTREGRWLAAVIAAGEGALLARQSAGLLWGVTNRVPWRTELVIPRNRKSRVRGPRILRRRIHPDDRAIHERIPVTSIERTLVDLAAVLSPGDIKRALERAEQLALVDWKKLRAAVDRARGTKGAAEMRLLLGYDPTPANETRSELERRFFEVVSSAGLLPYSRNVVVEGFEVDAFWPQARLVVELQSLEFHTDRETFIRDHRKNAALQAAGYRVLPVTDDGVRHPGDLVAVLAQLVGTDRDHA